MFSNILVPLDGSKLAEAAFGPAESLAKAFGAPITLLHIIEKDAPQVVHSDHHLTDANEAIEYLKNLAKKAEAEGILVDYHVHSAEQKDVAGSIIQHVTEEFRPDLIVMCAHGKGGIRDVVFGNIAQQVIAKVATPLLLIQPESTEDIKFVLKTILVPLDNESKHDESLKYAMEFARGFNAQIYMATVIPTYSTLTGHDAVISSLLPTTSVAFLEIQEDSAKDHVQTHLDEMLENGFNARAEIGRGDAADVIVSISERIQADLILLSTHRKAGMEAFWARSVAPIIVKKTRTPILLIPLKE